MGQPGFFDLSDRYVSLDAKKDPLVELDAIVPWEEFRPTLERVWRKPEAERKSRAGASRWMRCSGRPRTVHGWLPRGKGPSPEPPRVYRRVKHSKDELYVKAEIHPRLSG